MTITVRTALCWTIVSLSLSTFAFGQASSRRSAKERPDRLSTGIALKEDFTESLAETTKAFEQSALKRMTGEGLAAVLGGAELKMVRSGRHEVMLPIPQLTAAQIPLNYAVITEPEKAATAIRLRKRGSANMVLHVKMRGKNNEIIRLKWGATVLLTETEKNAASDSKTYYQRPTACVQANAEIVRSLAANLERKDVPAFAAAIQKHVQKMKGGKPVKSMDALGILDSGANWICTGNANLALALLRHRKIPARSLAVVPVIDQRLEMHRSVEYLVDGQWLGFDPSSVHPAIPLPPWTQVVMATTTIEDEEVSMKPRMGVSSGAPYGHEIEILSRGIVLSGKDFFWTKARPLAHFKAPPKAIQSARRAWESFLKTGELQQSQRQAAATRDATAFTKAWRR